MNAKKFLKLGIFAILICALVVALSACKSKENSENNASESQTQQGVNMTYQSISQQEAKEIMDTNSDYIILDVRTPEEYNEGHIKNAILIPDYEISERAATELTRKDQLILVYCRSGRRSKNASAQLANLGYTNIKEFGGINTWQYEIEK